MSNKAVFLDRDGTLNEEIFDTNLNKTRPPWKVLEFKLKPNVVESLQTLYNNSYLLFIVTNQPDYAKNNVSLRTLVDIRNYAFSTLYESNVWIKDDYYCFHHPTVCNCECRKPSPYFLLQAAKIYDIDLSQSWMIGDRDSDIECGQRAGTKTILIDNKTQIKEATEIILGDKA